MNPSVVVDVRAIHVPCTTCMSLHVLPACVSLHVLPACVLMRCAMSRQGPSMAALLAPHPSLITWMAAVRDASNPAYDEVHAILARAQHRFAQRRARM